MQESNRKKFVLRNAGTHAYDKKLDDILANLMENYAKNKKPIEVSFREIVNWLPRDKATHFIHPYPAKLLVNIPYFFLSNDILSKQGDNVIDPFCGSGTVLLEAILAGRNAIGADSNPLARLISLVKTTKLDIDKLSISVEELKKKIPDRAKIAPPSMLNLEYWFLPNIITELVKILEAINGVNNGEEKRFFLVCFSNIIKKVSLADPNVSVPVRLRISKYGKENEKYRTTINHMGRINSYNVIDWFFEIVSLNLDRLRTFIGLQKFPVSCEVVSSDARKLSVEASFCSGRKIDTESIDLVITSPPYVGAQKYIRASSLSLGWLGFADCIKDLEGATIGREHYPKHLYSNLSKTGIQEADSILKKIYKINPLRAYIAGTYLIEMEEALRETIRVLKRGGYLVLVVGANKVCGFEFNTQQYLEDIITRLGLSLEFKLIDNINSRILITKRNKTADMIKKEWALLFRK